MSFQQDRFFVFRPPCPIKYEVYLTAVSEKQKQAVLCVLGVSAVKIKLEDFITPIY